MNYEELANEAVVAVTREALEKKGYEVVVVKDGAEALSKIKESIPAGASVMNGSSATLEQIGYSDYLAVGKHGWVDLHAKVKVENDKEKRSQLRKQAVLSDYYLGSVHALVETGELVVASNTGSQLPHIVFTSSNLILVVSTKKIVATLEEGMRRLEEHVVPLEDKQSLERYKAHTALNKIVVFKGESPTSGRKIKFILVEENLGF